MNRKHPQIKQAALTALVAPAVFLAACGDSDAAANAETLYDANAIFVESTQCKDGITDALAEHDLGVTRVKDKADSTLSVEITDQGRNMDEVPEFGGIGHKAAYSATLTGDGDKVLFSTTGEEGSTTFEEMCEDIGDEIASRIEERRRS